MCTIEWCISTSKHHIPMGNPNYKTLVKTKNAQWLVSLRGILHYQNSKCWYTYFFLLYSRQIFFRKEKSLVWWGWWRLDQKPPFGCLFDNLLCWKNEKNKQKKAVCALKVRATKKQVWVSWPWDQVFGDDGVVEDLKYAWSFRLLFIGIIWADKMEDGCQFWLILRWMVSSLCWKMRSMMFSYGSESVSAEKLNFGGGSFGVGIERGKKRWSIVRARFGRTRMLE